MEGWWVIKSDIIGWSLLIIVVEVEDEANRQTS